MGDKKPRPKKPNSEMSSSSSSSTSSFDSDEETDVRDLKPIRGYLSNRRELARQLFKSVKNDKIRMMLPQILKNMNLTDLEEWCASELYGMSEARILCILNGQTMLNSSDTSETDDSGPSLEIISDTEEWLTDTDVPIKEEPSSSGTAKSKRSKPMKSRTKSHGQKRNDQDKTKIRQRAKGNVVGSADTEIKIKKEKDKDNRTNKEGESLLDLLELEMRARAIRALIRKEEDIIPSEVTEKRITAARNTLNSAVSASLSSEKNVNGKFNLDASTENNENNDATEKTTKKSVETGEDEDVVFVVVKPTPTIELSSSDDENDKEKNLKKKDEDNQVSGKIVNQRKNENVPEVTTNRDSTINERVVTIDKSIDGSDSLKIVVTKRISESSGSPSPGKSNKVRKISDDHRAEKNCSKIAVDENDKNRDKIDDSVVNQTGKGLFKKIKRKQNFRTKRKIVDDSSAEQERSDELSEKSSLTSNETPSSEAKIDEEASKEVTVEAKIKTEVTEKNDDPLSAESTTRIEEKLIENKVTETSEQRASRVPIDDDRLDDFEEIIDLDDYPDDMDDMENNDEVKKITRDGAAAVAAVKNVNVVRKTPQIINDTIIPTKENTESAETWASRYYQTDDVQNVIKESKIQSEIRKRLRERQRLSKLNNSPKLNSSVDGTLTVEKNDEKIEIKPMGSVQEYLALKNSVATSNDDKTDNINGNEAKSIEKSSVNDIDESSKKNILNPDNNLEMKQENSEKNIENPDNNFDKNQENITDKNLKVSVGKRIGKNPVKSSRKSSTKNRHKNLDNSIDSSVNKNIEKTPDDNFDKSLDKSLDKCLDSNLDNNLLKSSDEIFEKSPKKNLETDKDDKNSTSIMQPPIAVVLNQNASDEMPIPVISESVTKVL